MYGANTTNLAWFANYLNGRKKGSLRENDQ